MRRTKLWICRVGEYVFHPVHSEGDIGRLVRRELACPGTKPGQPLFAVYEEDETGRKHLLRTEYAPLNSTLIRKEGEPGDV